MLQRAGIPLRFWGWGTCKPLQKQVPQALSSRAGPTLLLERQARQASGSPQSQKRRPVSRLLGPQPRTPLVTVTHERANSTHTHSDLGGTASKSHRGEAGRAGSRSSRRDPTSPPSQTLTCGPTQLHAVGEATGLLTCGMYKGSPLRPQLNRSEVFSDVARLPKTNPRPVSSQPQVCPSSESASRSAMWGCWSFWDLFSS